MAMCDEIPSNEATRAVADGERRARELFRLDPPALLNAVVAGESSLGRVLRSTARVAAWRYGGRSSLPGRYRDLPPGELAAELASDLLLHLFESERGGELRLRALLSRYAEHPTGPLEAWLAGVARRVVHGLLRREARREGGEAPVDEIPDEVDPPWTHGALAQVDRTLSELASAGVLTPSDVEVYLRLMHARALGFTLDEVSRDLPGCSAGTLANRAGRVAKRLFAGLAGRLAVQRGEGDVPALRRTLPRFLADEAIDPATPSGMHRARAARGASRVGGPDDPAGPLVLAAWTEVWLEASWPAACEIARGRAGVEPWVGRLTAAALLDHLGVPRAGRAREARYHELRQRIYSELEAAP